jgi:hypothetical protein
MPINQESAMKLLFHPDHRRHLFALIAGILAFMLPFPVALTPEKAVGAHLIGFVLIALAAKAIWRPGNSDDLLLFGAGALAVLVPVFAWQMPVGSAWTLPVLGTLVSAAALRRLFWDMTLRNSETGAEN